MKTLFFCLFFVVFSMSSQAYVPPLLATATYGELWAINTSLFKRVENAALETSINGMNVTPVYASFLNPALSSLLVVSAEQNYFKIFDKDTTHVSDEMSAAAASAMVLADKGSIFIVVGLRNGMLEMFGPQGKKSRPIKTSGHGAVLCMTAYVKNDHEKYIIAGTQDNFIDIYNFFTGELVHSFQAFSEPDTWVMNIVVFENKGNLRIVATGNPNLVNNRGVIGSWNALGEKYYEIKVVDKRDPQQYNSGETYGIALYKDYDHKAYVAVTAFNPDNTLALYDALTGQVSQTLKYQGPQKSIWPLQAGTIRENGDVKIFVGYMDGSLKKWNTRTGALEAEIYVNEGVNKSQSQLLRGMLFFESNQETYVCPAGTYGDVYAYRTNDFLPEMVKVNTEEQLLIVCHQQQLLGDKTLYANSNFLATLGCLVPYFDLQNPSIISTNY